MEGLMLQCDMEATEGLGITSSGLERAHETIAESYRQLWQEEEGPQLLRSRSQSVAQVSDFNLDLFLRIDSRRLNPLRTQGPKSFKRCLTSVAWVSEAL